MNPERTGRRWAYRLAAALVLSAIIQIVRRWGVSRRELLPSQVTLNTILRLADAARLAFPDGSISVTSLRREASKGHLTVWRIAGKDMTSLAEIERMKDRCRVNAKVQGSGFDPNASTRMEASSSEPDGSSLMEAGITAQDALRIKLAKLKESSRNTSRSSTRQHGANAN